MKRSGEVGPNKMDNLSSLTGYGTVSGIAGMEGVVVKVKGNKVTLHNALRRKSSEKKHGYADNVKTLIAFGSRKPVKKNE